MTLGILLVMAMRSIDQIYRDRVPRLQKMTEYYYSEKLLKLVNYAAELAENRTLAETVKQKNRESLEKMLTSVYADMRRRDSEINSVEVTDSQGIILMRGHNPTKYGDDKSKTRIFGKALQTRTKQSGIEVSPGSQLLSLDAVAPIFIDNALVGLVKVGSYPKTQNLSELKEILDADVAVVMENRNAGLPEDIMKKYEVKSTFYPDLKLLVYGATIDHAAVSKVWATLGEEPRSMTLGGQRFLFKKVALTIGEEKIRDFNILIAMPERERHALLGALTIAGVLGGIVAVLVLIVNLFFTNRLLLRPIHHSVGVLSQTSGEIYHVANHVASASQVLADNVSQQAAAIEETSSAMEEMASMTRQNADNSAHADALMKQAAKATQEARQIMSELLRFMEEINRSSQETHKIIKTIDEIAFQTNLLALNAAVEAARAGEAGAGFAVVADEVRNLAMRAAEAARTTADLIEGTVTRVKQGKDLTESSNQAFVTVHESVTKVAELMNEIASASHEQSEGIVQVNSAVAAMDKTVQQTSAHADESASAARELTAHADQLRSLVEELQSLVGRREEEAMMKIHDQSRGKETPRLFKMPQSLMAKLAAREIDGEAHPSA